MSKFNLDELKRESNSNTRYERRIAALSATGQETKRIETVIESAITNIKSGQRSFVIYGDPQSGKTEMMIALTAKLLDFGFQIIVVLLNDSVQLLGQNLERFQRSGISPTPKKFSEILSKDVVIGNNQWIIFSKKNASDLDKLIEKLSKIKHKVVIDDEADYATPNGKINVGERTKINALTAKLLGSEGVYIGVTATPARLDLNRTHDNANEFWIDFPPHKDYTGQDVFFPPSFDPTKLPYRLTLLSDQHDDPKFLRNALFSFLVTVAYLNTLINSTEKNYCFLIHTSGNKVDHSRDHKEVMKTFEALREESNVKHTRYYEEIWNLAKSRFPAHEQVITKYIYDNRSRDNIVVMNSDKEKNAADNRTATTPSTPFTVAIGGNIVSRGVTFNNLLSMFFTRDVKHRMQQDTYVQRARMFGSRYQYLKYFELIIPATLFLNWHRCFIFHRLSLESRRKGNISPVWLEGKGSRDLETGVIGKSIAATSAGSIYKTQVTIDQGEMSFERFDFNNDLFEKIRASPISALSKLREISSVFGPDRLPKYLIDYIESFCPEGDDSIAIHESSTIMTYNDAMKDNISRRKGLLGKSQLNQFPNAIHHIKIFFNDNGKARFFYKYHGNIRFLKVKGRND